MNGALQRSDVCRSQDDILDKTESWKAALFSRGWSSLWKFTTAIRRTPRLRTMDLRFPGHVRLLADLRACYFL